MRCLNTQALRLALLLASSAPAPLAAQQPTHADLIFKSTPQRLLTLDLYLPEGVPNPPLVVYIHGGGWKDGSPKNPPLRHLLVEGFALASISYRLSHEAKFPAQLEDVCDAVAWLVASAPKFGYDASRIALIGGSAGGHLAMLGGITLARDSLPVRAVVSYFGPSDFFLRAQTQPSKTEEPGGSVYELLGGTPGQLPEVARAASPALQVDAQSPPLLIFHGTGDNVVHADQSESMAAAYRAAERPVTLVLKTGAGHKISDFEDPDDRRRLREFLKARLVASAMPSEDAWPRVAAPTIPDHCLDARAFGALGDGVNNDSAAIQAAIDQAHASGGGTVFFPPGRYPAASVRAKSRVRLELDPAAEIFGAPGPVFDLPIERPGDVYQDMGMSYPELSIIWGDGVEDFAIVGGKINGGSITRHDPEPGLGNKVIAFINSRRLHFDSVTHETGGHFVYNLNGCEDITLKDIVIGVPRGQTAVKSDGNMELRTRDSVSLVSCHRVHLTGCHFTGSGDDTIGIKNHYALNRKGSCKDILVEDGIFETGCNALQLGSETAGDFTNIAFRNITIRRAMKAALSVTSNDGGHVRDVRFENIRITGAATPIFLAVTDRLRTGEPGVTVGSISGVTFKNIDSRDGRDGWHGEPHPITLVGHPASWIREVSFENVSVLYPGGEPAASPKYELAYTKRYQPDRIGQRPASALYAREVEGLSLRGVSFAWERPDPRPAVVGRDWKDVSLRDLSFAGLPAGRGELVLDNAKGVTIKNAAPLPEVAAADFPARETPFVWPAPGRNAPAPVGGKDFSLVFTEPLFAARMVWIAPGAFRMGSPEDEPRRQSDEQAREVVIKDGFWIAAHEVTQRQWFALMGTNPSRFQTDPELPVHNVSFNDAMEFCRRLTLRERAAGRLPEGWTYTLPTEAQWEYACRAGTTTAYAVEPVDEAGWHDHNTGQRPVGASPMPVGLKTSNAWGLHDMHGNVWEWCLDPHENSPDSARQIIRGGSWRTGPFSLRSANRASLPPEDSLHDLGFRVVLNPFS